MVTRQIGSAAGIRKTERVAAAASDLWLGRVVSRRTGAVLRLNGRDVVGFARDAQGLSDALMENRSDEEWRVVLTATGRGAPDRCRACVSPD